MTSPAHPRYRLDHVGITVPDLESAVNFFTAHLDAEVLFALDRFVDESGAAAARLGAPPEASFALAMLRLGEARVELLQWWDADSGGMAAHHRGGGAHLALAVRDAAAARQRLAEVPGVRAMGEAVTFSDGPTPGLTNAFVESPWGLLIELMSWPDD
ncbi:hypothetical protein D3248_10750 [Leucobacter zeae]|nr:hypothetical protein [Leucobacter zeae]